MLPDDPERFGTRDLGGGVTVENVVTMQRMQVQARPAVARLRATSAPASWLATSSTCPADLGFATGHVSSLGHTSIETGVIKPNQAYGHRQPKEMSP
jgi:hypothetical protein